MRPALIASLMASMAACAGTLDGGDPPPPPPNTSVELVVRDGYQGQPGLQVTFQDSMENIVAEVVTDGEGRATADLPDGGLVTVVRTYPRPTPTEQDPDPDPIPSEAYTYVGVKPGDKLVLGRAENVDGPPSAINIMVPRDTPGTVRIKSPCGEGAGQAPLIPITIRACASEVMFYVMDGQGASFVKKTPVVENVDLTAVAFTDALGSTIGALNIPPGANVTIEKRAETDGYAFFSTGERNVTNGATTVDLPGLEGLDAVDIATVQINNTTSRLSTRSPFQAAPTSVDLATMTGMAAITEQPRFDDQGIYWTEDGGPRADFYITRLQISRTTGTPQNPGPNLNIVRIIVGPYEGNFVNMPRIGGVSAQFDPILNDNINGAIAIAKVDGGYDAIRARALAVNNIAQAVPMNTRLLMNYFGQDVDLQKN